jgi:3-methyladenine DNA glycosylase Tag
MMVEKSEEQKIRDKAVADLLAKQKRELSDRMAKMGRVRSDKKIKALRENAKKARAKRWGSLPVKDKP